MASFLCVQNCFSETRNALVSLFRVFIAIALNMTIKIEFIIVHFTQIVYLSSFIR